MDITKMEEELVNEEIAKALAEIAKGTMTEEGAQAKIEEMQSKYGALPESEKQAIAPAVDRLKTAVQQRQQSRQQAASSGNANTNYNAAPGTGSNSNNSGNAGGGSTNGNSGGNTGGGFSGNGGNPTPSPSPSPAPAPTPQPAEKYYPTMTPAEMESYAKSYAESIGLIYDPNASKATWSWSAPSTTYKGMTNDLIKSGISSGISNAKSHGANYVRRYAEPTGVTDSAGNPQYRIYILMG